ncbi:MAG: saccharopine dehydrogenase NADP-binding domain-containing protein [Halobacteria archaeon]
MARIPVALLGATGFTGTFAARALDQSGAEFLLAGRRVEALKELARSLESKPGVVKADATDPAGLRALAKRVSSIASTAGPFLRLGPPVVEACIAAGTHYTDTTGEPPFVKRVFDQHADAKRAGCALVPGVAIIPGLGDFAAALAARGVRRPEEAEIRLRQWVSGGGGFNMGRGTLRSLLELMGEPWYGFREGRHFEKSSLSVGPWGVEIPSCEVLTVPRHLKVKRVVAAVSLPPLLEAAGLLMEPVEIPVPALRARGLARLVDRLPGLSNGAADARARVSVKAVVRGGGEEAEAVVRGRSVYDLSGRMVARMALELAEKGPAGALAPAQAVEPGKFLKSVGVEVG